MITIVNSNYNGEVLSQLLVKATTGNELVRGGHIRMVPNISKMYSIPRLKTGKMLQKRKEMPTGADSKGGFSYDEKKLEPKEFMAFTTFNPRSFENVWREFQPKGNLVFSTLDPSVQNQLLAELAKTVDFELGGHYINGKFSAVEGDFFDGILTRIVADSDVIKIADAAAITEENILATLKAVKANILTPVLGQQNLKIFMSRRDFDAYDSVITDKPYKGADYSNMSSKQYKGLPIVVLADLPNDVIIAAVASMDSDSNFWAGVSLVDDTDVVMIDKLSAAGELYFFKMLMKADTNIVFGEEIVLYDARVAAAKVMSAPRMVSAPVSAPVSQEPAAQEVKVPAAPKVATAPKAAAKTKATPAPKETPASAPEPEPTSAPDPEPPMEPKENAEAFAKPDQTVE